RVLAIDQIADDSTDKPAVVRAVTLEVDTVGAQKLALAASVGSLSLMLRKAGEANVDGTRRVTLGDLANGEAPAPTATRRHAVVVVTTRAAKKTEFNVPIENDDWRRSGRSGR